MGISERSEKRLLINDQFTELVMKKQEHMPSAAHVKMPEVHKAKKGSEWQSNLGIDDCIFLCRESDIGRTHTANRCTERAVCSNKVACKSNLIK